MTAVLTAVGRWDSEVATALGASTQVRIIRRCADLADLLATAAAGLGEVALVSDDLRGLDLSAVAGLVARGLGVVGVTGPGDEAAERRLRQLGISTVVIAGSALAELETALAERPAFPLRRGHPGPDLDGEVLPDAADDTARAAPVGLDDPPQGRLVAVWGPTGAPGRTTVAVTLATELAGLGLRTVLVDADTYGGCVAPSLSLLDEAPGVAAAARAAEQGTLDLPTLARLTPEVTPGLRVLTGIPTAERWTEIRQPAMERTLELCRSLGEVVVVDCGFSLEDDAELSYDTQAPRRNAATLSTLAMSDEVLAVGSCDPVGLQRLVRGLQELAECESPRPRVVVNRVRASSVGSRPERRVADALARFAGVEDVVFVPDDPQALDTAVRDGRSLAECAPASPVRAALRALAAVVAQRPLEDSRRARR